MDIAAMSKRQQCHRDNKCNLKATHWFSMNNDETSKRRQVAPGPKITKNILIFRVLNIYLLFSCFVAQNVRLLKHKILPCLQQFNDMFKVECKIFIAIHSKYQNKAKQYQRNRSQYTVHTQNSIDCQIQSKLL